MLAANALEHNPDIGDDELLDVLSSNLCRCTGYQNIIKAVRRRPRRDAGGDAWCDVRQARPPTTRSSQARGQERVRSGGNGHDYPTPPPSSERRVLGHAVTRIEDRPLVTGRGRYAGDINFAHQLHMRIVRSTRRRTGKSCRSMRPPR